MQVRYMLIIMIIIGIVGCSGDHVFRDEWIDTEPPTATVNPAMGATVKSGDIITVTFSEEIGSVTAAISAGKAKVTLAPSRTLATIALADLPSSEEEVLLVIDAEDIAGNAMTAKKVRYKTIVLPPTDGTWNGTTDQGQKISFVVADGGRVIKSLTIEFEVCLKRLSISNFIADINNQFSIITSGQTTGSVSGIFTSPTKGKGTYNFYDKFLQTFLCGNLECLAVRPYLYRLQAGDFQATRKMVILK